MVAKHAVSCCWTSYVTNCGLHRGVAADAMVWAPQGVVSIVGLRSGFELRGGRPGHTTLVHSASVLPARELNVVRLHLGSGSRSAGSVTMTCLHTVMGRKPGQSQPHPMLAFEVRQHDFVRTPGCDLIVIKVEHDVVIEAVVEIQLEDREGTFFTGGLDIDPLYFVEVRGISTQMSRCLCTGV